MNTMANVKVHLRTRRGNVNIMIYNTASRSMNRQFRYLVKLTESETSWGVAIQLPYCHSMSHRTWLLKYLSITEHKKPVGINRLVN